MATEAPPLTRPSSWADMCENGDDSLTEVHELEARFSRKPSQSGVVSPQSKPSALQEVTPPVPAARPNPWKLPSAAATQPPAKKALEFVEAPAAALPLPQAPPSSLTRTNSAVSAAKVKPAAPAPAAPQRTKSIDTGALPSVCPWTAQAPTPATTAPAPASAPSALAAEDLLDSSRHGLPLLFKTSLSTATASAPSAAPSADVDMTASAESISLIAGLNLPVPSSSAPAQPPAAQPLVREDSNLGKKRHAPSSPSQTSEPQPTPSVTRTPSWSAERSQQLIHSIAGPAPQSPSQPQSQAQDPAPAPAPLEAADPSLKKQKLTADGGSVSSMSCPSSSSSAAAAGGAWATVVSHSSANIASALAPSSHAPASPSAPTAMAEDEKKPAKLTPQQIAQRKKQVQLGKSTPGYQNYLRIVPRTSRTREHPMTPNPRRPCSKRSWDGQVRKWRRLLHQYDPQGAATDHDAVSVTDTQSSEPSEPEAEDEAESAEDQEKRQRIGEALFLKIAATQPQLAGKITGMLLELDLEDVEQMHADDTVLATRVQEALDVLREAGAV